MIRIRIIIKTILKKTFFEYSVDVLPFEFKFKT